MINMMQKTAEAEAQQMAQEIAKRNAKINRIEHFRALEDRAQAYKNLKVQVTDQNNAIWRSNVLP